jgi:hypothetical protein
MTGAIITVRGHGVRAHDPAPGLAIAARPSEILAHLRSRLLDVFRVAGQTAAMRGNS